MTRVSEPHPVYGLVEKPVAGNSRYDWSSLPHAHESDEPNGHLVSIYDDEVGQFATVVPFIQQGLKRDERCLYVADDTTKDDVRTALREGGIDVEAAVASGALSIHTRADTYLRTGDFDREAMLEFWEESLVQAREHDGFAGLRVAAEMTWALDSDTALDSLVNYEALLNTLDPGEDSVTLCQYNRNRFPPDVIAEVVRNHPLVVHNNTVRSNTAYQPPAAFFGPDNPPLADTTTAPKSSHAHHESTLWAGTCDIPDQMEREFQRYEAVVETTDDLVCALDADGHFMLVNEAAEELAGVSRDELLGEHASTVFTEETVAAIEERIADRLADGTRMSLTEELPLRTVDGTEAWYEVNITLVQTEDGTFEGTAGIARDITDRKRRETRLAGLNELAAEFHEADSGQEVADIVVDRATSLLNLPVALVAFYDSAANTLDPVAVTSAGTFALDAADWVRVGDAAWQTFADGEARVVSDAEGDGASDSSQIGVWSLGRHGVFTASMDEDDEGAADAFGATVAGTMHTALDSAERLQHLKEREARLTDLTDQLERVNRINDVIRRIDRALVAASTRSTIEETVCEELARVDPYRFVVVSDYDPIEGTVVAREWADDEQGYLDTVGLDDDPTSVAAETRDPQVVQEFLTDSPLASWREAALARGFGSCLALPLVYRDSLYGVLTVFGDRPQLFDEMEREVLAELADNIAQSVNAVESKKALVSDRVVELAFETRSEDVVFVALATETGGTFDFEGVVPQSDGRFRGFFTVRGADPDDVHAFLRQAVAVEDCQLIADRDGSLLFSCLLTDAAVVPRLVEHGAVPRELTAEPGEGRLVVELSSTADPRVLVETLQARYPSMEVVAKREHERSLQTRQGFRAAVEDALTDRQLEALQTAYYNGYFESPRASTGEAVATALDISQPTFAAHLRTAHRKILNLLFEASHD